MKKLFAAIALLISVQSFGQNQLPIVSGKNTVGYIQGMFRIDSVALVFPVGVDTATARAAFPTMPMIGRVAWQNDLPYVLTVAGWQCMVGGSGGTATDTTALSNRIDLKENSANKSANSDFTGANDTEFPTRKAVKDFLASQLSSKVNTSDVGVTVASVTQLNTKQDALGYTAENVSNKSNSIDGSYTKYPSNLAVNNALSEKVNTTDTASLSSITGRVAAGTNVTITGAGTYASPYSISASGGGSGIPYSDTTVVIPTLHSANTFTAAQTFNGNVTVSYPNYLKIGTAGDQFRQSANNAVLFDISTGLGFTKSGDIFRIGDGTNTYYTGTSQNMRFGDFSQPTAKVNAAAASTSARTGQLKLDNSTSIPTTPEAGLINNLNGRLMFDSSNAVRKTIAFLGDTATRLASKADLNAKQNTLTLTTTGTSGAATLVGSTLNIPQYSGGGSGDSSFVTLELGTRPNYIGTLWSSSFPTTTGLSSGNQLTIGTSNKLYIQGGNYWGKPSIGDVTSPWRSGLQYGLHHMAYEKLDVSIFVKPMSKVSGGTVAIVKGNNGLLSTLSESIIWDLSNGANSGTVGLGLDSVAFQVDTQKLAWSVGDSLELYFHKDGVYNTTAGIKNHTTGKTTQAIFTEFWSGSGGYWNFVFLKDSFQLSKINVSSFHRKNVPFWAGDSQLGLGVSTDKNRLVNLIYMNNSDYFNQVSLPSIEARYVRSTGILKEWLHDIHPPQTILAFGYNDESQGQTAAATKDQVDSLRQYCVDSSSTPFIMGIVPRDNTTDAHNDSLQNLASQRGVVFFDIRKVLKDANGQFYKPYSYDNVHINNKGSEVAANEIKTTPGFNLLTPMWNDSITNFKVWNGVTISTPSIMQVFGRTSDGKTGWAKSPFITSKDYIPNSWSRATPLPLSGFPLDKCTNCSISLNGVVGTDSALFIHGREGGNIDYSYAAKNNFTITNNTPGGSSSGHAFPTYGSSANNNLLIQSVSTKGSYTSTINGSYNVLLGTNVGVGTVSGSGNFNVGLSATPSALSSGSNNIIISKSAGQSTGSNAILIGTNAVGYGNYSNRVIIGAYDYGCPAAADIFSVQTSANGSQVNYLGGYKKYSGTITYRGPEQQTGNSNGISQTWVASAGTGTGTDGGLTFQSFATTDQTTPISTLVVKDNKATLGGVMNLKAYTVATLPTGSVGDVARVTDALTPVLGSTVSGGGSANAVVWYNGTNWTVMGL